MQEEQQQQQQALIKPDRQYVIEVATWQYSTTTLSSFACEGSRVAVRITSHTYCILASNISSVKPALRCWKNLGVDGAVALLVMLPLLLCCCSWS